MNELTERENERARFRVAMFVWGFPVLSETFVVNQIVGLVRNGVEVDIFTRHDRDEKEPIHSIVNQYSLLERVISLDTRNLSTRQKILVWFRSLARAHWFTRKGFLILRQLLTPTPNWSRTAILTLVDRDLSLGGYSVFHCQFGDLGAWLATLSEKKLLSGALVTAFRGHDLTQEHRFTKSFYKTLFRHGNAFLPVSLALSRKLTELGCRETKIKLVPSPMVLESFPYREPKLSSNQACKIISVGRLVEMKGFEFAIKSLLELKQAGISFKYTLIGSGPLEKKLKELSHQLDLVDTIKFVESMPQEALARELIDADLMVCSSITATNGEQEGIPNVVKEAMAIGLPVVATSHAGIPEIVKDGVTGFLVPERDPHEIAECIKNLLDRQDELLRISRNARNLIEEQFALDRVQLILSGVYQEAIASRLATDS